MLRMDSAAWIKRCADIMKCSVFDVLMQSGVPDFPPAEIKKFKRLLTPGEIFVIVQTLEESEQVYSQQSDEAFNDKDFKRAAWLAGSAMAMNERASQWRQLIKAQRRGLTSVASDAADGAAYA
jgi:hypothetical protein